MRPGLARAIPMGIVGFCIGALIAIVIRILQGLDPNPAAPYAYVGPALVLGAFFSAGTFVWGMGGFDPRMNEHGEHDDHAPHAIVPATHKNGEPIEPPASILSGYLWRVLSYVLVVVLGVALVAFLPQGPQLKSVAGDGDPSTISYANLGKIYTAVAEFTQKAASVPLPKLPENLQQIEISYLVLLVIFVAVMMLSLFAVAGLLGWMLTILSAAAKRPNQFNIPWRALALVAIVGGLTQFPILAPTMDFPLALVMPAFIIPPLAFLIAYRKPIWLILLLVVLLLPPLVPTIQAGHIHWVYNLLIFIVLERIILNGVKFLLSEGAFKALSAAVYGITLLAVAFITVQNALPDLWQVLFLLITEVGVFLLATPVDALKMLVPPGIWQKFAAVRWNTILPEFSMWLVDLLRNALPKVLGQ